MRLVLLAAAMTAASPAVASPAAQPAAQPSGGAQAAPAGPDTDVVVVGRENRERQVNEFARDLADVVGVEPIARFDNTRPCPGVVGLSAAHNAAVTTRMRRVAEAAGIPIAAPGCRPTILVVVAPEKEEMIRLLRQRYPVFFTNASGAPLEIPRQSGPVTAWHLGGLFDRDNQLVGYDAEQGVNVVSSSVSGSRISAAARPVFLAAVVVIEQSAVVGLTPTQIADYATMRAFARIDPRRLRGTTAPTILTVLEASADSEVPVTLTQWDLSYLRALYSAPAHHYGQRQLSEIRRRMGRDMDGAAEATQ
jgi:hypothetical protein